MIFIVFVSFGGLFFLLFLAAVICWYIKKKKKHTKKTQQTELVHVDEHYKVKEAIVNGPDGPKAVVLEIEDDVHFDELKNKENKTSSLEASAVASSSGPKTPNNHHHQIEHKA